MHPLRRVVTVVGLHGFAEGFKVEGLDRMDFLGVSAEICEAEFHFGNQRDDESVGGIGRTHGHERTASIHDGELIPGGLVVVGHDRSEDGLTFVHREQIADGTAALLVEGAGVLEEIQDGGKNLDGGD